MQSYGAGNGPSSRSDLLAIFREAADRGVIIINTTQCSKGAVSVSYATGKVCQLDNSMVHAFVITGSVR